MSAPCYEIIDHTADFAFRVSAPDLASLVRAAVLAVVDAAWGLEAIRPGAAVRHATLPGDDGAMAIFLALSEVLFLADAHGLVPAEAAVEDDGRGGLLLRLECDRLDPARHRHRVVFKAATLHGLVVAPADGGLQATVLMDA